MRRDRAITPLTPETVERSRATLIDQGRARDATLVSVLAYAGVRPQEVVALRWRNVRKNTFLIEQAVADERRGVSSADGQPWREYDWRNWRRRSFRPAARAAGGEDPRPYNLRHSCASLLIHEGRHSIVEIAAQLGAQPDHMPVDVRACHAELQEAPRVPAEQQIRLVRAAGRCDAARRPPSRQLSLGDLGL